MIESSPYVDRFQPTLSSHVCGAATVRTSGGGMPTFHVESLQPSNHHADENGSMPPNRAIDRLAVPPRVLQHVAQRMAGLASAS